MAAHAGELGIDPARIVASGQSAGGGLSAAVALLARDRNGPRLAGQLLGCPMLDDRNETVSARQYDGIGAWDRNNNDTAWTAIAGGDRFTDLVSPYTAPARATDLAGLPGVHRGRGGERSAMRPSTTPPGSGPPASRPNCTSGPAATTGSTASPRRRGVGRRERGTRELAAPRAAARRMSGVLARPA
jgi:hypothetical protein